MSVSSHCFVPETLDAFKRAAKDLARHQGLPLQVAQEALARAYGHPDLHAIQRAIGTAKPGPFRDRGELDHKTLLDLFQQLNAELNRLPKERRSAPRPGLEDLMVFELALFDTEAGRRACMASIDAIADQIEGRSQEAGADPAHYFSFVVRAADPLNGHMRREGHFELTEAGYIVYRAAKYQHEAAGRETDPRRVVRRATDMQQLTDAHPHNPYPEAMLVIGIVDSLTDDDGLVRVDVAERMFLQVKRLREVFESRMPARFAGAIIPDLAGDGYLQNWEYMRLLEVGARCAFAMGRRDEGMAWASRCAKFDVGDRLGCAALVADLKDAGKH